MTTAACAATSANGQMAVVSAATQQPRNPNIDETIEEIAAILQIFPSQLEVLIGEYYCPYAQNFFPHDSEIHNDKDQPVISPNTRNFFRRLLRNSSRLAKFHCMPANKNPNRVLAEYAMQLVHTEVDPSMPGTDSTGRWCNWTPGDHRTILDVPVLQYGTKKILSQLTSFAICPESKSSKLKLRKLPDFLSKMTSLTKLTIDLPLLGKQDGDQWDFEGDEIPAFPLSLTALTNLETLNVENCPHEALGSLLPWVFQLPKLKHLTIAFTDVWNLACPPKLQEFRDKQLEDLWFCTTKVERTPPPSSGGCVIS